MSDMATRALLIGNWEYTDPDRMLRPLKGPKNDLQVLRQALAHPEYGLFNDEDITVLENAPTPTIATTLLSFVQNAGRGVILLIYYSGHVERLSRGYLGLCGVEVQYSSREAQTFSTDQLRGWIENYQRSASTVIILDYCYAGQFKGTLMDDLLGESFGQGTSVLSNGGNEPSPDALHDDKPSPFTEVLAELLVEPELVPKRGSYLSADDLYDALLNHEPKLLPPPRRNLQAEGGVPLARRPVREKPSVATKGLRGYQPDQKAQSQPDVDQQTKRDADAAAARVAESQGKHAAQEQALYVRRTKIFLCYRREDTQWPARSIYESLSVKYGRERVFRDIDSTPAGVKYSTWIESRVGQCSVMVVLIGDAWSSAKDSAGRRRLELPNDWVRQEIEAALRRNIPIVPVRVQGARMHLTKNCLLRSLVLQITNPQKSQTLGGTLTLEGLSKR
jgi:hypothetical protein